MRNAKKLLALTLAFVMVLGLVPMASATVHTHSIEEYPELNLNEETLFCISEPGMTIYARFVTFLWRAAGEPAPTSDVNPFTDISEGDWYYNAVLWAVEKGVTQGIGNNLFGIEGNCNRVQAVTFLFRALAD